MCRLFFDPRAAVFSSVTSTSYNWSRGDARVSSRGTSAVCTRPRAGARRPIGVRGPRHNDGDAAIPALRTSARGTARRRPNVKWLCVGHDGFEQGPCHANMFSK